MFPPASPRDVSTLHVTPHAIHRYRERVEPLTDAEIIARLSTPAIHIAATLNAECFVRLPSGHRIVVKDHAVITVLPADNFRRQVQRQGLGRYPTTPRPYRA